MRREFSEAQRKAAQRYRSKFKYINLRIEAWEYEELRKEAQSAGLSLNSYIHSIVEKRERILKNIQTPSTDPEE